jgi:hypothetical protein
MSRFSTAAFVALSILGASGAAYATDPKPGDYKLTVGTQAPCVLTLTAEGGATLAADCKQIEPAAHWHATGNLLKLYSPDEKLIALFKATQNGFSGRTIPQGVELAATR